MNNTTPKTTIDVGEVDNAIELVFTADRSDVRYILQPKGTAEDYLSTLARFPKHQIKRTSEYYIEDTAGRWYLFANVDCFDPPIAIIRARSFESAYDVFCCEFERWLTVGEADAKDYAEDDRTYNDNGTHIDTEGVQGHELILLTITIAKGSDDAKL